MGVSFCTLTRLVSLRSDGTPVDSVSSSVVNILKLKFSLYIVQSIALHSETEMTAGLGAKTSQYVYSENICRRICDAQRAPKAWSWFPLSPINCVEVLPRRGQTSRFHTFVRSVESVLMFIFKSISSENRSFIFPSWSWKNHQTTATCRAGWKLLLVSARPERVWTPGTYSCT